MKDYKNGRTKNTSYSTNLILLMLLWKPTEQTSKTNKVQFDQKCNDHDHMRFNDFQVLLLESDDELYH